MLALPHARPSQFCQAPLAIAAAEVALRVALVKELGEAQRDGAHDAVAVRVDSADPTGGEAAAGLLAAEDAAPPAAAARARGVAALRQLLQASDRRVVGDAGLESMRHSRQRRAAVQLGPRGPRFAERLVSRCEAGP